MTVALARTSWTTIAADGDPIDPAELIGVALHWPGSKATFGPLPAARVARYLQQVRDYHVTHNGWADIAYQVAVDQTGHVWDCRGITLRSAANGNTTVNARYGAVLFLVGENEPPTDAALEAFRTWRTADWLTAYPRATAVVGHAQVRPDPTECPGPALTALIHAGALRRPPRHAPAPSPTAPTDSQEDDDMPKVRLLNLEGRVYLVDAALAWKWHIPGPGILDWIRQRPGLEVVEEAGVHPTALDAIPDLTGLQGTTTFGTLTTLDKVLALVGKAP